MRLILASASPARLATLRSAGIEPEVRVSGVDEDALLGDATSTRGVVELLARAKAEAVAQARTVPEDAVLLGCDSMLELEGERHGKPRDADEAAQRWRRMRGCSGALHTGHWLIDLRAPDAPGAGGTSSTVVHFADLSDAEIDAYVATGEPLAVAGAFTIDGLGGPFVTGVVGDPHGVVGLSLPVLRDLLGAIGITIPELWAPG
jgi:septum formation protein